jgi:hypothetical protein
MSPLIAGLALFISGMFIANKGLIKWIGDFVHTTQQNTVDRFDLCPLNNERVDLLICILSCIQSRPIATRPESYASRAFCFIGLICLYNRQMLVSW